MANEFIEHNVLTIRTSDGLVRRPLNGELHGFQDEHGNSWFKWKHDRASESDVWHCVPFSQISLVTVRDRAHVGYRDMPSSSSGLLCALCGNVHDRAAPCPS